MFQKLLIPQIDEEDRERIVYFIHDDASPHYLTNVRAFRDGRFSGQWIDRDAPIIA